MPEPVESRPYLSGADAATATPHEWFEARREQVGTHSIDCWKHHPDCAYWVGRQESARLLDRLSGDRNPDDPLGSSIRSQTLVAAAHRIRFPQEYEGCAVAPAVPETQANGEQGDANG